MRAGPRRPSPLAHDGHRQKIDPLNGEVVHPQTLE